jgi:RNA polymerase sigma factor for flagellar operon FliA
LARTVTRSADPPEVLERFNDNLPVVDIIARQVGRTIGYNIDFDDLKSFGREGLLDAARRFDPARGVPFRGYANYRIRGAILDGVRSMGRLPRRAYERLNGLQAASLYSEGALEDVHAAAPPAAAQTAHAEQALSEHLAAMATATAMGLLATSAHGEEGERTAVAPGADPEQALTRAELLRAIREAVNELPPQEAELVRRHYFEGDRFDHVAAELGLSKSWASRLHTRAILRLTQRMRSTD